MNIFQSDLEMHLKTEGKEGGEGTKKKKKK